MVWMAPETVPLETIPVIAILREKMRAIENVSYKYDAKEKEGTRGTMEMERA